MYRGVLFKQLIAPSTRLIAARSKFKSFVKYTYKLNNANIFEKNIKNKKKTQINSLKFVTD